MLLVIPSCLIYLVKRTINSVLLLCADSSKHAMKDGAAVLILTPVWVSAGVLCH